MVALLREFPTVRLTFNLVPSLVVQLEAFAEDRAKDRSLELSLKPAAELTDDDKRFLLTNFFHAQRARMIEPAPRYAELLRRRDHANANGGAVRAFSEGDFRDLQVWHKLAWVDPFFVESDVRIHAPDRERPQLHRRRQAHPARRRTRGPACRGPGVPRAPPHAARWNSRHRRSITRFSRCCAIPMCICERIRTRACRGSDSGIRMTPVRSSNGRSSRTCRRLA